MLSLVTTLIPAISGLLSELIPDRDKRDAIAHEIATMTEKQAHDQIMAQVEVNKQEAAHKSLFVAGWRPAIGWICGTGLGYNYVLLPFIKTAAVLSGTEPEIVAVLEPLDFGVMSTILLGMLGLGGMRSYEKRHGVAREK